MSDFPFAIVGFDLDGTFVDTSGDLTAAVNHSLGMAGRRSLTVEQVKPMIGGGAKHMLEQGLAASGGCDPVEARRLYKLMLGYYEANVAKDSVLYAHALDLLDELDRLEVRYAIVTNKFESLARKLLTGLGVLERFATVIGGDTMGPGNAKPSRAPIDEMIRRLGGGRAAFVGDSIYDITAAKNAGIASVAVSYGFLMQPVAELGADAIIDGLDELVPALRRIGGTP